MNRTRRAAAAIAALASLSLAGCAVADPDTSQAVLHYTGGPFSSQAFSSCIAPGTRSVEGAGDFLFYYPNGRRTFAFTGQPGSDSQPISVSTKDQVQLISSGTLAFRLNTDCTPYTDAQGVAWPGGKLQKFHDTIGRQLVAYAEDGGAPQPEGWANMLRTYIGQALDRAADQAGLRFGWQELSASPDASARWTQEVEKLLPQLLREQMGDDLIIVENVQPGRPAIPEALVAELNNRQAATLRQQTSEIDQRAAEGFPGGLAGYQAYQQQQAINDAIKGGKVQVLPVPQGSPIIVGGQR